jgi:hypothetical protein
MSKAKELTITKDQIEVIRFGMTMVSERCVGGSYQVIALGIIKMLDKSSVANIIEPSEQKLDKPARVRGVIFNAGVNVMTVVHAAQRCFEEYSPGDAVAVREEILQGLSHESK